MFKLIHIYSDGACSGNPGPHGWGLVVVNAEEDNVIYEGYRFLGDGTSNIAELNGFQVALDKAIKYLGAGANVVIKTDSEYCVKGYNDWMHKWAKNGWKSAKNQPIKNMELWNNVYETSNILNNISNTNELYFSVEHVKGHHTNKYNNRADYLARKSITKNQ